MNNIEKAKSSEVRKKDFLTQVKMWEDKSFNKVEFLTKYDDLLIDVDCVKAFLEIDFMRAYTLLNKSMLKNNDILNTVVDCLFISYKKLNSEYIKQVLNNLFYYGNEDYLKDGFITERISKINLPFAIKKYGEAVCTEEIVEYFLINENIKSLDHIPLSLLKESKKIRDLLLEKNIKIPYEKLNFTNEEIIKEALKTNEKSCNMINLLELLKRNSLSLEISKQIFDYYSEKLSEECEKELNKPGGLEKYLSVLGIAQGWKNFINCMSNKSEYVESVALSKPDLEKINSIYYNDETNMLSTKPEAYVDVVGKLNDNVEIFSACLEKIILKNNIVQSNIKKRVNKY